jgi:hypothetical protein
MMQVMRIKEVPLRMVMPMVETIVFEKKMLHKTYGK